MSLPQFTTKDIQNLNCLKTLNLSMGKYVKEFEEKFADKLDSKYAVMTNSGSSANLLAISCLKATQDIGDEIALPVVTWPTTLWPIIQMGFRPIFEDVNIETLNILPSKHHEVLFNVHLLGQPSDVDADIVIEDTCEALGAKYKGGQYCGTKGLIGTFSFYFSHHICTIEGGMLITDSEEIYEEALIQRSHGWTRHLPEQSKRTIEQNNPDCDSAFLFPSMGYNLRPTEINAELGLLQLDKLDEYIKIRQTIAYMYGAHINYDFFHTYKMPINHSFFAYPIVALNKFTMDNLKNLLKRENIPFRGITGGNLLRHPFNKKYKLGNPEDYPNAQIIHDNGIFLGLSTTFDDKTIEKTCKLLGSL